MANSIEGCVMESSPLCIIVQTNINKTNGISYDTKNRISGVNATNEFVHR